MIHDVNERVLELPLENYILTFDDGLYSHFAYWNRLKEIDTRKIFFIATKLINKSTKIRSEFPFIGHEEAMAGRKEGYMTLGELKLMFQEGAEIGGHSHTHERFLTANLIRHVNRFKKDINLMMGWFETYLLYKPVTYCFPFNEERALMRTLLKSWGIFEFFGEERTPVEKLL